MKKSKIAVSNLYREKGRTEIERKFLEKEVYNEAMRSFVIVGTDAIILSGEEKAIYLAKRRIRPMKDWWVIGGRSFNGELPEESIVRCFKRETALKIAKKRFNMLCINRYLWKDREQEPQNVGSDNLIYTFTVKLSEEEIKAVSENLNREEYEDSGLQGFDLERLQEEKIHPMIISAYKQIFNRRGKK
ncbi:MAG: NUDIX domain-containing protein [Candidatus Paceibacterota bacterium]